jgi:hypothetical protein
MESSKAIHEKIVSRYQNLDECVKKINSQGVEFIAYFYFLSKIKRHVNNETNDFKVITLSEVSIA